jgi:hypothetical protein
MQAPIGFKEISIPHPISGYDEKSRVQLTIKPGKNIFGKIVKRPTGEVELQIKKHMGEKNGMWLISTMVFDDEDEMDQEGFVIH